MSKITVQKNSLVLYKTYPAHIKQINKDKLEIELSWGKNLKVRPKDITMLHPGPMQNLGELIPQKGDVETAWELLDGESVTLPELADLIYDIYTPATAWATWQLVAEGLYFYGTPEEIVAYSAEEIAKKQATRQEKVAKEQAWSVFLDKIKAGNFDFEDGSNYLRDVEAIAIGRQAKSRLMQELGHAQNAENAHTLLLKLGYWDSTVNPYPQRMEINLNLPSAELPDLSNADNKKRVDLTHLPAFAIDDEGSNDPDDALSLDGSRLWVHVADVAAIIKPNSPVDLEARNCGTNLYLPERTIRMLPEKATLSLGLGLTEISPALSFGLDITPDGEILGLEVVTSWVRVQRFTYEQVETMLDAGDEPFNSLYRLAYNFQERRRLNEAVFIDLPEVKVRVHNGQVIITAIPLLRSRNLVQEAMLMAGEAVARFALRENIPIPFATQERVETERDGLSAGGIAGMYAMRRTMKRREFSSIPAPHIGLGLEFYSQVTSPLRRYLDLVIHQQLRAYLLGQPILGEQELLERIGTIEDVTLNSRRAERLSTEHWKLVYLQNNPDWRGEGLVVEKRERSNIILIPELAMETKIYIRESPPLNSIIPLILNRINLAELDAHFKICEESLSS